MGELLGDLVAATPFWCGETSQKVYFVSIMARVFADPRGLMASLAGEQEFASARELAATALSMAEDVGDTQAQNLFLEAVQMLAPVCSPQYTIASNLLASKQGSPRTNR